MGIFHSYVSLPEGIEYFQYAMLYPSVSEICRSIQGRSLAGVRAQIPRAKRAASPCGCRLAPGQQGWGWEGDRPQMRPEPPKIKKIRDVDQFSYGSMMISRSWSSFNGTDWLFLRVVPSSTHFWTIDDIVSIFKRMTLEPLHKPS